MRYMIRPIGRLGTNNTAIRTYANDRNAVRYFTLLLRHPAFESGQYELFTAPPPGARVRFVAHLYKTV